MFGASVAVLVMASSVSAPGTAISPWNSVNVAALMLVGSIALLKVADGRIPVPTSTAFANGVVAVTVGGAAADTVVNVHTWSLASATPAASVAADVMVAVYSCALPSCAPGWNVAVCVTLLYATEPT